MRLEYGGLKMKRLTLKAFLLGAMSVLTVGSCVAGALAWFITSITINNIGGTGSTESAYFAYGTGTQNDPYGIATPKHLNNLAWLQYKGMFNVDKDDDGEPDHVYFELANDINQDGPTYVIPPIGTEENPFVGVFNGNGHTIYNVTVTNNASSFTNKPINITYDNTKAEIIGFFGVVGKLSGESYSSSVNSLTDVTLDNFTVESTTTNTLIGLAAGYVNAEMSGVKVGTSTIKTNGNAAKTAYSNKLSDYGLVGYTTKTGTSGTFEQKVSKYYDSRSSSDDAGWGGSIAIKDLYTRLTTIRSTYAVQDAETGFSYDDYYDSSTEKRIQHTIHKHTYNNRQYEMKGNTDSYNETTRKNDTAYNEKIGAVQMTYGSSGIYYLMGGHYSTGKYATYHQHSGKAIKDRNGHYLAIATYTASSGDNVGTFEDVDNEDDATLWNLPTGSSGTISTTYYFTPGTATTYYLRAYNSNVLQLTATAGNATTFTRSTDSAGHIRYSYNGYYLGFSNAEWGLIRLPTAPNPTTYSSYMANSYQISINGTYVGVDGTSYTAPAASISASTTYGWRFTTSTGTTAGTNDISLEDALGREVYIYTLLGNNHNTVYYFYDNPSAQSPFKMTIRNSTTNRTKFTIRSNGNGTYQMTDVLSNKTYYFGYDYQSGHDVFSCRDPANTTNFNYAITFDLTQTLIENYATLEAESYNLESTNSTTHQGEDISSITNKSEGMDYSSDQDVTYIPLNIDKEASAPEVSDSNTGYIVGGSTYSSAGSYNTGTNYDASNAYGYAYGAGNVRVSSFYTISDNLKNYNSTNKAFNTNSVWTVDGNGVHKITDNNNDFVKYTESKGQIEQKLGEGSSIYGFHFMQADVNVNNVVNAKYAMVNGEHFSNYKMPANSIDFNLKDQGYVNFFAAPYGNRGTSATTIDSFFSIHHIKRNGTEIESINHIQEIWSDDYVENGVKKKRTDANGNIHSYIYKLDNGQFTTPYSIYKYNSKTKYVLGTTYLITDTNHNGYEDGEYHQIGTTAPTNYQKIFDTGWLEDNSYASGNDGYHEGFYFEIPTNPGEYALSAVSGKTYGAYLMYLDIGANAANKDQITSYALTTYQSGTLYPYGVDFNTSDVTGDEGGETFGIIIAAGATSTGEIVFTVSGTTIDYEADFTTKYAYSEKAASGLDPPAAADPPSANGVRVIYTHILCSDDSEWDIVVTQQLDSGGNETSTEFTTISHNGQGEVQANIPESFVLNSIKPVVAVPIITLTRTGGKNTFNASPSYSGDEFNNVSIILDVSDITISAHDKATGYSITINGTPITSDPQSITL